MDAGALDTRRLVLALLVLGMIGTATELALLGHWEERLQPVPLVALGVGLAVAAVVAVRPRRGTVLAFGTVMALFVAVGVTGLVAHYRGNVEFELEMYPTMGGLELFKEAMTGATPALAPGSMCMLGLLGLIYCHRHPRLRRKAEPADPPRET